MSNPPILPRSPEVVRLGRLALFAALYTYLLILAGGIVRITGSGLGCGNHWPKCNGVWIPQFTVETLIEYMHRALAAGIGFVVLFVLIYAWKNRALPGFGGQGGLLRPVALGAVMVVAQALLGALTVKLDLPTDVTVVHFVTALVFASTLLVTAVRAGTFGGDEAAPGDRKIEAGKVWRVALMTTLFGLTVIAMGAMTANTPGASVACQGFPLCNGSLTPPAGSMPSVHIHYTHRMLAYLLFFHVLAVGILSRRRAISGATKNAILAAQIAVVLQVLVAAAMVMMHLPAPWQVMHLATGAAVWFALVCW
ncbi:MAG: COX15/CtaA family protein, partial [Longimicrobiales bacterium]